MTQGAVHGPQDADHVKKVCHDLKQNIATGLLLSDPAAWQHLEEPIRRRLDVMHHELAQAAALVAILSEDELGNQGTSVDLTEIATLCVEAARTTHEVSLVVEPGEHVIAGDPVLLHRAVGNLLDNACRATRPPGRVVVEVGSRGPEVWVEVTDEGPGFGEIASGTGIGLQVARAAVWAGAGKLRIETGPRSGTTVRISFPAALRALP